MSKKEEVLALPELVAVREQWESKGKCLAVNVNKTGDRVLTLNRMHSGSYMVIRYFTGPFSSPNWTASVDANASDPEEIMRWFMQQPIAD